MGTAELYRAVEALPEVLDSLVVDLEYLGRESWMPLFVVLREGEVLDEALTKRIKDAIKTALSAAPRAERHVPGAAIPRTLSGKKMELPVKKLLLGTPTGPGAQARRDGERRAASTGSSSSRAGDWLGRRGGSAGPGRRPDEVDARVAGRRSLRRGDAAVDVEDLAGDERCRRAAEEERRADHVLGLGDAPERDAGQEARVVGFSSQCAPISVRTTVGATPLTQMPCAEAPRRAA